MDELQQVIDEALVLYQSENSSVHISFEQRHAESVAAVVNAVRAYLASDGVVERAAKAHCDYFGGEGWWETGLLTDTLPEGRKAMIAAITAATKGDGDGN